MRGRTFTRACVDVFAGTGLHDRVQCPLLGASSQMVVTDDIDAHATLFHINPSIEAHRWVELVLYEVVCLAPDLAL